MKWFFTQFLKLFHTTLSENLVFSVCVDSKALFILAKALSHNPQISPKGIILMAKPDARKWH
jgi:hypothetical protein